MIKVGISSFNRLNPLTTLKLHHQQSRLGSISSHSSTSVLKSKTFMNPSTSNSPSFHFSDFNVSDQVFYHTPHSFAIVNLKPIVRGHVLVIPRRKEIQRLKDLKIEELQDLFNSVQKVSIIIEKAFEASSLTISIQDGPDAGQSVSHLHVHILPRHPNDFNPNDQIYEEIDAFKIHDLKTKDEKIPFNQSLQRSIKVDHHSRQPRSSDEMKQESIWLSKLFT